jgi:hypothetical protein
MNMRVIKGVRYEKQKAAIKAAFGIIKIKFNCSLSLSETHHPGK